EPECGAGFWRRDLLLIPSPNLSLFDSRVVDRARVRREAQIQQHGDRLPRAGWYVEQQVHLGTTLVGREIDCHLSASRFALESGSAFVKDVERHNGRASRAAAKLVLLEETNQLRATLLGPGLSIIHTFPVGED